MAGYSFDNDELSALFAAAGDAVKKASAPAAAAPKPASAPPAASQGESATTPASVAPLAEDEAPGSPAPPAAVAPPLAAPAPAAGGPPRRLTGGVQEPDALAALTEDGSTVRLPYNQMRGLSVGRVGDRLTMAFVCNGTTWFLVDDKVAYKGLVKQLQATLAVNWRQLVTELAEQIGDTSDPGVAALTGAGGMVPRYMTASEVYARAQR
jgi:hypothetical protein